MNGSLGRGFMNRKQIPIIVVMFIAILMPSAAWADERENTLGIGVKALVCFPEMTGINAFLAESRLDSFGEVLLGVGGNLRVGQIGDLALGASAWGFTTSSGNAQAEAQLYAAAGGLDLGWEVDRDERSAMTVGAVLGGGTTLMRVSGYPHPTALSEEIVSEPSNGLVPEPDRVLGVITLLGQPYVGATARLAPWLSVEFRLGYALQVVVHEFGDLIGLTGPSLVLSGPMISVGVAIGAPATHVIPSVPGL